MKKLWKFIKRIFKYNHQHGEKQNKLVTIPEDANFTNLKIQIHGMEGFTDEERTQFLYAMNVGSQVLNSNLFKEAILEAELCDTKGMTNTQIWELMCTGKDLYNLEQDNDIDVFITMYHNFWAGTIGYTYPNTFKTWINRKFFSKFDESSIFGNVIHEAMHNLGFEHKNPKTKLKSVPYVVGYIARDLAKEYLSQLGGV